MSKPEPFPVGRDAHTKCGTCGQRQHVYLFPFTDPNAYAYANPPRAVAAQPAATYERRARKSSEAYAARQAEAAALRVAAQAKGRNTSKCLPCYSKEGNE